MLINLDRSFTFFLDVNMDNSFDDPLIFHRTDPSSVHSSFLLARVSCNLNCSASFNFDVDGSD